MYIDYYKRDKAIPKIINLLRLDGINVSENNIKSWSRETMINSDVLLGISYIKSIEPVLSNVIVYTNKVKFKELLSIKYNIMILDILDIMKSAERHHEFELLDLIN